MIEYLDKKEQNSKEIIRGAICQISLTEDLIARHGENLSENSIETVWNKIGSALNEVSKKKPDFIILPELSVPSILIDKIANWAAKHNCIIVAGSHYHQLDDGTSISRCPVIFPDKGIFYSEKQIISPFEKSPIFAESVHQGQTQYIFKNTKVGNFGVLICADFLDNKTVTETIAENLDFLFIVSCTPDSNRFQNIMGATCKNSKNGIYICMSNLLWKGHGDGKSSVFAMLDRTYHHKLAERNLTDLNPEQKIWQASSNNDFIVCDFNIQTKKPPISKAVSDQPNLNILQTRSVLRNRSKKYGDRGDYKLIAFDLDGTLLRSIEFSWVSLWRHCGDNDVKWKEHLRAFRRGELEYQEWCEIAVAFFRENGLKNEDIKRIAANNSQLTRNFYEGMAQLKDTGFKVGVISGGIDVFLEEKIPQYNTLFDSIYINHLMFDASGLICGVNATSYDFEGKAEALAAMCDQFNLEQSQSIFVGDTFNDEQALASAGYSILYADRSSDPASLTANHSIFSDNFTELVEHVNSITDITLFQ